MSTAENECTCPPGSHGRVMGLHPHHCPTRGFTTADEITMRCVEVGLAPEAWQMRWLAGVLDEPRCICLPELLPAIAVNCRADRHVTSGRPPV